MRLKPFLILIACGALFSWIAWGVVLANIDPFASDIIGFLFFYLSLLAALIGTLSLLVLFVYDKLLQVDVPIYRLVSKSLIQSTFFATSLVLLVFLQGSGLLTLWGLIIFMVLVVLIGSFSVTLKST